MVKHQVADNSLASKDLEDVQSKSWKREKERKRIHPKSKIRPNETDAVLGPEHFNDHTAAKRPIFFDISNTFRLLAKDGKCLNCQKMGRFAAV